jgi:hypothetical protein
MQQVIGAICVQSVSTFPVDTPFPPLIFCVVMCVLALVLWRLIPHPPPITAPNR